MTKKRKGRATKADDDMKVIEADPFAGPTVKALLRLSAFAGERKKRAARTRKRTQRNADAV